MLNNAGHQTTVYQNHNEIPPHIYQDGYNQKHKKITSAGGDTEKLVLSYTAGRNVKWYSCFGKQSVSSSKGYT